MSSESHNASQRIDNDAVDMQRDMMMRLDRSARENSKIYERITNKISDFCKKTKRHILMDNPHHGNRDLLEEEKSHYQKGEHSYVHIQRTNKHFESFMKTIKGHYDKDYWDKRLAEIKIPHGKTQAKQTNRKIIPAKPKKKNRHKAKVLHKQLLDNWGTELIKASDNWEIQEISKLKREFLEKLYQWLENINKIYRFIDKTGLEPGFFLDFSQGDMTLSDMETIHKWMEIIEGDDNIKKLCDLLGRINQISHAMEIERIETTTVITQIVQDFSSKEEIIGIKLGNDITNVVPSEFTYLLSKDTEPIFDMKFVDSRLLCHDLAGQTLVDREIEKFQEVKKRKEKGPIIICVDTSGSMHGMPEIVAKALTLHMVALARKENRNCYIINFSTDIDVFDCSTSVHFQKLISFLQKSFHGGTDVAPALSHAVQMMVKEEYRNADTVVISDFIMNSLGTDLLEEIKETKNRENKFYSLCISGEEASTGHLKDLFDSEWIYDPHQAKITELEGFSHSVINRPV